MIQQDIMLIGFLIAVAVWTSVVVLAYVVSKVGK